jgi:hypothetical protein
MFRASLCSSSGGQLYIYSIWYRPTLYAAIKCTDQERTAWSSGVSKHDPQTDQHNWGIFRVFLQSSREILE